MDRILDKIRERGLGAQDKLKHTANPGRTSSISAPIFDGDFLTGTLTLIYYASAMPLDRAVDQFGDTVKEYALQNLTGTWARQRFQILSGSFRVIRDCFNLLLTKAAFASLKRDCRCVIVEQAERLFILKSRIAKSVGVRALQMFDDTAGL